MKFEVKMSEVESGSDLDVTMTFLCLELHA